MNKTLEGYAVYYRYRGEKKMRLRSTPREVKELLDQLKRNRRKFLGYRKLELAEVG
jgi:hypothetical protein